MVTGRKRQKNGDKNMAKGAKGKHGGVSGLFHAQMDVREAGPLITRADLARLTFLAGPTFVV
jgi:hypothetical protein